MFKLNALEVLTILAPVIIVLWKFWVVVYAEMKAKHEFSKKELEEFAREAWSSSNEKRVTFYKTRCLSCLHFNEHIPPISGQYMGREHSQGLGEIIHFYINQSVTCEKCGFAYSEVEGLVRDQSLWDKMSNQETTKEIMADYEKDAKKLDGPFKLLMFAAIWFGAALGVYGLSFVPWGPLLTSFWILLKEIVYYLTRWYSLVGLFITLLIFYQWHKQAIKDKFAYYQNISRTRKRYRSFKERKETVTEDELKLFVNETNSKEKAYDDLLKELDRLDEKETPLVSEDEIPF